LNVQIDVVPFRRRVPNHCLTKICAGLPDIDDGYGSWRGEETDAVILAKNLGHEELFDVLCKLLANDFSQ
jgi:hypothetical protein